MRCDRRDFQSIQVWFGPSEQIIHRTGGFGPGQNWWFASESGSATVFIRQTWWVRCITLDRWDTSLSSRCRVGCERQGQQAITWWALWNQASRNNLAPGINNLALGITCRSNCLRHSPQSPRQHDTSYILEKWSVTLWSDRQLFGIVITKQLCASIPVAGGKQCWNVWYGWFPHIFIVFVPHFTVSCHHYPIKRMRDHIAGVKCDGEVIRPDIYSLATPWQQPLRTAKLPNRPVTAV